MYNLIYFNTLRWPGATIGDRAKNAEIESLNVANKLVTDESIQNNIDDHKYENICWRRTFKLYIPKHKAAVNKSDLITKINQQKVNRKYTANVE